MIIRLFLCFILFVCISNSYADDRKDVLIGVIAPLTGNAAHIGKEITRTLEVIDQLQSSKKRKYKYAFNFQDGKAATDNSPTRAFSFLAHEKKIKFLITATSGETLQVGPLAQKNEVLTFAVLSSHKDVKKIGSYVFRTFIDVERGMRVLADQIIKDGHYNVALLTEEHTFTLGIKKLLEKYLADEIIYIEDYHENSTDLKSILLKAKSHGTSAYYFNCSHPRTCAIITNQAVQLGIKGSFYSYLHIDNPEYLDAVKDNGQGVRFLSPPDLDHSPEDFKEFMEAYQKKYSESPQNEFLVRTTYDAANCIINGIESVGPSPKKVVQYLYDYDKSGALGKVSFDKNGDIEDINYVMKEIIDGKPQVMK